jgi:carbon-monoxide dehydrogenase medium subunit
MTRHADVAASPDVKEAIPALAILAEGIGDPLVRNRGTIGGSVANADPAADYPAAVLGLGATVITNRRGIPGDDFFTGLFETALEPGEVIIAVRFPVPERAGYIKFPNPASRFAIVGVFVAKTRRGSVRVAVTGAGSFVFRLADAEARLTRHFAPEALDGLVVSEDGLNTDIHASAEYRAHVISVMAKRAVAQALG